MLARPGIKVEAGGREWIVPSLTAEEIERLDASGCFTPAQDRGLAAFWRNDLVVARTALAHNYPDITDEEIKRLLAPHEIGRLAQASVYASYGLSEVPSPEAPGPKAETTGETASEPPAS